MGYRTVVILYNDQCSEWSKDPDLGQKISVGMNDAMGMRSPERFSNADLGYGRVVQCTHADTQTLAVIDSYHFSPVAHSFWRQNDTQPAKELRLMQDWADRMGYRLVRKPTKEPAV